MEGAGSKGSAPYQFGSVQYVYHRVYRDQSLDKCHFMYDRIHRANHLFRKDLKGHFGCVNALEFSKRGGELIASGGDDRRILLWKAEEALNGLQSLNKMKGEHHSNIFCLAFDNDNSKILSGGNDEQVILHDIETGTSVDVFSHEDAVYGLAVDPLNSNIFATACDDGRILIYDTRASPAEDPFCLANYMSPMHAVVYNPMEPRLLATANSKEGIGLWDIRKPRSCLLRYGGSLSQQSCMSVRINSLGNRLIALRRRLPPVLYDIHSPTPVFQFDHSGYYNSCTMKSCCFAGEKDEFLLSGSDDFNLYMWKIPEEPKEVPWVGEAHLVLKGHRSIVNQVRYNPSNQLIISSGVEKVIKIWSPYSLPRRQSGCHSGEESPERTVFSHEEYINLVLGSGEMMTHDYSQQSTEEDPRMMAFFDSLVQRELEGWSTDEPGDSDGEIYGGFAHTLQSSSPASNVSNSDDDGSFSPFTIAFASVMARQELTENHEEGSNTPHSLLDLDLHCPERVTLGDSPTAAQFHREQNDQQNVSVIRENSQPSTSRSVPAIPPDHIASSSDSFLDASDALQSSEQLPSTSAVAASSSAEESAISRRSISSLIAQKRKEYLAAVKRAGKHSQPKRKSCHTWSSLKRNKRSKSQSAPLDSDSSNSGSSDYGAIHSRFSSDDSDSQSSHEDLSGDVHVTEHRQRIQAEHRRKTCDLKRLKNIRTRVMKSGSESESEIPTANLSINGASDLANAVASTSKDGHPSDKSEIGPHIHVSDMFCENLQGSPTPVGGVDGISGVKGMHCTDIIGLNQQVMKSSRQPDDAKPSSSHLHDSDALENDNILEHHLSDANTNQSAHFASKSTKLKKRNYRSKQRKKSSDED